MGPHPGPEDAICVQDALFPGPLCCDEQLQARLSLPRSLSLALSRSLSRSLDRSLSSIPFPLRKKRCVPHIGDRRNFVNNPLVENP